MLKNRLSKLESQLSKKLHWSGIALVDKHLGIMKIPTLGFEGTEEEGYKKLRSMDADAVLIIDDIPHDLERVGVNA